MSDIIENKPEITQVPTTVPASQPPVTEVSVVGVTTLQPSMELAQLSTTSPEPIDLTATNPLEMRHAQVNLIEWIKQKIVFVNQEWAAAKNEATELAEALEQAKKNKWNTRTIAKHAALAQDRAKFTKKRIEYYEKILTALEAGYYVVPPLPGMEIFAIRTDKKHPKAKWAMLSWSRQRDFSQSPDFLPEGEGAYRNPQPVVEAVGTATPDGKGNAVRPFMATEWQSIDFPLNMLKPKIMEASSRAMALKVFDEMGVLPQDFRRNPDPVILGKIYSPTKKGSGVRTSITFMVAWHLNTKDL